MAFDPRDLAAAYALDALDPDERRAFEERLRDDPELRQRVEEYRAAAAGLGRALEEAEPPAGLRARILAQARAESGASAPEGARPEGAPEGGGPSRRHGGGWLPWLALAASLAALTWLGVRNQDLRAREEALQEELADLRDANEEAAARLARLDSLTRALTGPDVRTATLTGEDAPALRLIWSPGRDLLLVAASGLPPAGPGRTYQLWGLGGGGEAPVSLGTFDTSPDGTALVTLVADAAAFELSAVTEEPAGGSPQPTTTPFLVGSWAGPS